jgi:hypothetical protein
MANPPFTMSKYASEVDLLRDKCAWLEAQHARLREVESASFALTAALAQMGPGYAAGETEFLNREGVMDLVMAWRARFDAASKTLPPKDC